MKTIEIKLSDSQFSLLEKALSAAQLNPECSEEARDKFANLGWDIRKQVK